MSNSILKRLRLISQILFFAVFSSGILIAGAHYWPLPGDFFFRLDPLVAIIAMFTSGMLISIRMMSGWSSCAISIAWRPVLASPTISMPAWLSSSMRSPERTMA